MPSTTSAAPAAPHRISLATATSITIANMVGTGVFTSLGFQVLDIRSGFALLLLWILGGVLALCGALAYGELAAALPRSGGEYNFLGRIYHPAVGFVGGWISATVGFAAPIALAALAFGEYLAHVVPVPPLVSAFVVVLATTAFHLRDLRLAGAFQNAFTVFKIALILVFLVGALASGQRSGMSFAPSAVDLDAVLSAPFGISLLFVMYAYAGWNASTYIVDEVRDPLRTVPRSLALGTGLVLLLYVGLNGAFLWTTPIELLETSEVTVGHTVASHVFGAAGGRWMSGLLSIALISVISAMVWAGPRVLQTIGRDLPPFRGLARTNAAGIPARAILLQTAIVCVLLLWSFKNVLIFTQFILAASSALTVGGVYWLRRKAPDLPRPYRTWGYPWTPALFLLISAAAMVYALRAQPVESLAGLALALAGLPIYYWSVRRGASRDDAT